MGPRAGLDRGGKSRHPPGFDPRTVQPVASRYTDCATRPTKGQYLHNKLNKTSQMAVICFFCEPRQSTSTVCVPHPNCYLPLITGTGNNSLRRFMRYVSALVAHCDILIMMRQSQAIRRSLRLIQGDQKFSVHLMITVQNNPHIIDDLKMAVTEYILNVYRAILNTVFENTVRCVNKCVETGGGHFCNFLYCIHQVHREFLITL